MTPTSRTVLLAAFLVAPLAARPQGAAPLAPGPTAIDLQAVTPPAAAPVDPAAGAVAAPPAPAAPKRTHGLFPLWGDAVRAKGFELPNPYTVMVTYYAQESDLAIGNLMLGLNGGPLRDFSGLIQVPAAQARASALSVRPAIMVFPFLSLYGVFSRGSSSTDVTVASPVPALNFETTAESGVTVVNLGATFQLGYRGFFGVADFNYAVSDVERLADLVGGNVLSFRLGKSWKLNEGGRKVAVWAGTAGQVIDVETKGSVALSSVLPPTAGTDCSTLPTQELRDRCTELVTAAASSTVEYSLDKRPVHVWNVVAGGQFALDREWAFRAEVSFLNGRTSVLIATEYGFDVY